MSAERESMIAVCVLGGLLTCLGLGAARAASSFREIDQTDPISGLHWRRTVDPQHPAAPPRLTLVPGATRGADAPSKASTPCVHAGDRVLIQTGDARSAGMSLVATALANGFCGDRIRARVAVTGAVVQISVLGSGAGALAAKAEAWR